MILVITADLQHLTDFGLNRMLAQLVSVISMGAGASFMKLGDPSTLKVFMSMKIIHW